jgi:hypothetical protein
MSSIASCLQSSSMNTANKFILPKPSQITVSFREKLLLYVVVEDLGTKIFCCYKLSIVTFNVAFDLSLIAFNPTNIVDTNVIASMLVGHRTFVVVGVHAATVAEPPMPIAKLFFFLTNKKSFLMYFNSKLHKQNIFNV